MVTSVSVMEQYGWWFVTTVSVMETVWFVVFHNSEYNGNTTSVE